MKSLRKAPFQNPSLKNAKNPFRDSLLSLVAGAGLAKKGIEKLREEIEGLKQELMVQIKELFTISNFTNRNHQ